MVNKIHLVERFVYRVIHEKYEPSEEEVRAVGEVLGQSTKKLNVVLDRYRYVFSRYVEKKCVDVDSYSICIYAWSQRTPFKVFPLSMHLTGTIILFKEGEPREVLAYPIPKALSYAKSSDVSEDKYGSIVPREVTKRVDGWQVTAYYNPLLNRWIFATRYVLHNMYFEKGRLITEPFDVIANPFVYVADKIGEEENLYNLLYNSRGYTFTFVLEGPEPSITRPPHPLGEDYRKYKLYLLMARDPSGKLYTWSETNKLLRYRSPEALEPKPLSELYKEITRKLDIRSYLAYIDTGDAENPTIIELESDVYPEAMNVKYMYNAKSAALLIVEGLGEELKQIVGQSIVKAIDEVSIVVSKLKELLVCIEEEMVTTASWEILRTLSEFKEDIDVRVEEFSRALKEKNINRVLKKVLGILLEGSSLASKETLSMLTLFSKKLEQRLKFTSI
ncbi:MAG: hypothetical protein QXZ41_05575 [Ignisphaera sp.]